MVTWRTLLAALGCAFVGGCMSTDGDVLSTLSGDAAVEIDAAEETADAPPGLDALGVDADDCAYPCPGPALGDVAICGRLIDLETNLPVTAGAPDVRVFDFIELRENPTGALELSLVTPDECGWFHTTIDAVAGWTVVHTGTLLGTGPYRRVTTVVPTLAPGQTIQMNAFVLRGETDDAWSDAAGLPLGTFAGGGSVMAIFVDISEPAVWPFQGAPVTGVTMTADGLPHAVDDYYFSDSDAAQRSVVDPGLTTTGPNGAALMRGSAVLAIYSGQRAGCGFNDTQGLPIPTAVQVQEIAGICN